MKFWNFVLFFSIVILIYTLINAYIFIRALSVFPFDERWRSVFKIVFWLVAFSYLIGRILERLWISPLSETLIWVGSFWMAAMFYFFLIVLFADIFRLVNFIVPFSATVKSSAQNFRSLMFFGSLIFVFVLVAIGFVNALFPKITTLDLEIHKKSRFDSLTVVTASDIHLGTIVGKSRFSRIVSEINNLKPDLVLLAGDVVDEDLAPVIKENLGDDLLKLSAKFGVFAITGNHEFIGGVDRAAAYLGQHGIQVLRDEVVLVQDDFYIVGREDRSVRQFNGNSRKSLAGLVADIDFQKPLILLDHQPFGLDEAAENKIDLQISGHTHHGQLFPLNLITNLLYEKSWGYLKKGNTHFYVSSGVGTWGPPIRLGNRPEIVQIRIRFSAR
ncbi:MAG: metallophosphoesterase [Calditrichaeota bacterium]|nr:metallophosphoesterase [Calditrichota bacterium]